jgi:hypothetical protein
MLIVLKIVFIVQSSLKYVQNKLLAFSIDINKFVLLKSEEFVRQRKNYSKKINGKV